MKTVVYSFVIALGQIPFERGRDDVEEINEL